jgi:hypothetical protein
MRCLLVSQFVWVPSRGGSNIRSCATVMTYCRVRRRACSFFWGRGFREPELRRLNCRRYVEGGSGVPFGDRNATAVCPKPRSRETCVERPTERQGRAWKSGPDVLWCCVRCASCAMLLRVRRSHRGSLTLYGRIAPSPVLLIVPLSHP